MSKPVRYILIALGVIVALVLMYFGYNYFMCKTEEGTICTNSSAKTFTGYTDVNTTILPKPKVKCGFFSGRSCA